MSPALDAKKVAIITGASGGIGAGLAAAFRATGHGSGRHHLRAARHLTRCRAPSGPPVCQLGVSPLRHEIHAATGSSPGGRVERSSAFAGSGRGPLQRPRRVGCRRFGGGLCDCSLPSTCEVIDVLHATDRADVNCSSERWRLEAVLERIDAKIAELRVVRGEVRSVLAACDKGACVFVDSEVSA
jgi:NAD(P)-dependent dehydrogenase (short-subunit alcohol dehydrogenase family)